jgi:hypothetical protein
MTTRQLVDAKLDELSEDQLHDVYDYVTTLTNGGNAISGGDIFERLRQVRIEGPNDFARNLDLYLSGERTFDDIP